MVDGGWLFSCGPPKSDEKTEMLPRENGVSTEVGVSIAASSSTEKQWEIIPCRLKEEIRASGCPNGDEIKKMPLGAQKG